MDADETMLTVGSDKSAMSRSKQAFFESRVKSTTPKSQAKEQHKSLKIRLDLKQIKDMEIMDKDLALSSRCDSNRIYTQVNNNKQLTGFYSERIRE